MSAAKTCCSESSFSRASVSSEVALPLEEPAGQLFALPRPFLFLLGPAIAAAFSQRGFDLRFDFCGACFFLFFSESFFFELFRVYRPFFRLSDGVARRYGVRYGGLRLRQGVGRFARDVPLRGVGRGFRVVSGRNRGRSGGRRRWRSLPVRKRRNRRTSRPVRRGTDRRAVCGGGRRGSFRCQRIRRFLRRNRVVAETVQRIDEDAVRAHENGIGLFTLLVAKHRWVAGQQGLFFIAPVLAVIAESHGFLFLVGDLDVVSQYRVLSGLPVHDCVGPQFLGFGHDIGAVGERIKVFLGIVAAPAGREKFVLVVPDVGRRIESRDFGVHVIRYRIGADRILRVLHFDVPYADQLAVVGVVIPFVGLH